MILCGWNPQPGSNSRTQRRPEAIFRLEPARHPGMHFSVLTPCFELHTMEQRGAPLPGRILAVTGVSAWTESSFVKRSWWRYFNVGA
jgi:hypothetical protein